MTSVRLTTARQHAESMQSRSRSPTTVREDARFLGGGGLEGRTTQTLKLSTGGAFRKPFSAQTSVLDRLG